MMKTACATVLIAPLLFVAGAWAQAPQAPAAQPKSVAPAPADKALVAMGKEIEKGLAAGQPEAFDRRVDAGAIADAATFRVQAPPQAIAGFKDGLVEQFSLGSQIVKELQAQGATYKFLRVKRVGNETRLLFRLVGPNGLNYHELTLRNAGPEPKVTDVHVYITGESMSQTLRRAFLQAVMSNEKGQAAGQAFVAEFEKIRQLAALAREGKAQEAMKVYDSMTPKTQAEKIVQVARVTAAARLDEASYTKIIEDYRRRFKDDPTLDLLSVDAHVMRGEEEQAMAAIGRIEKSVGGDPYLDVMRGSFYLAQDKLDKAKGFGQKAAKAEPGLFQAYDMLLAVSLKQNDHPETARLLSIFEDKFGMRFGDLSNAEEFKAFRQSDSYKKWRQRGAAGK